MINEDALMREMDCRVYPLGELSGYKYAVICTFFEGRLVLSRHRDRNTWEMQGGHIESGETPIECAARELFEESGIVDAELCPVCDYRGFSSEASASGVLFLAFARSIGELPESEIEGIGLFDELPKDLTYPRMLPRLYYEAIKLYKSML